MWGYKQENGYFLKQGNPKPVDPVFAFDGLVVSQELTTNVVALTTQTVSDSLSGMVATLSVATLVE